MSLVKNKIPRHGGALRKVSGAVKTVSDGNSGPVQIFLGGDIPEKLRDVARGDAQPFNLNTSSSGSPIPTFAIPPHATPSHFPTVKQFLDTLDAANYASNESDNNPSQHFSALLPLFQNLGLIRIHDVVECASLMSPATEHLWLMDQGREQGQPVLSGKAFAVMKKMKDAVRKTIQDLELGLEA